MKELDLGKVKGMSDDTVPIGEDVDEAKNALDDLEKQLKDLKDSLAAYDEA